MHWGSRFIYLLLVTRFCVPEVLVNTSNVPKVIFAYFPQFHEIPENNRFWGYGSNEWFNVRKTDQNIAGMPLQKPTELTEYNLLNYDVRKIQGDLLKRYGGHGFIYYHYWFKDRPVMGEVLMRVLKEKAPDVPFMICWANENWTRRWDGGNNEVMIAFTNEKKFWQKHFDWLLPFYRDPRYIKVEGKPVFTLYLYPYANTRDKEIVDAWNRMAQAAGFPGIYWMLPLTHLPAPIEPGFDAMWEFHPNMIFSRDQDLGPDIAPGRPPLYPVHYKGTYVNWDNSPRRPCTTAADPPITFERRFRDIYNTQRNYPAPPESNFMFVMAWNEWGEGNVMEPNTLYGRGFLEALQRVTMPEKKNYKITVLLEGSVNDLPAVGKTMQSLKGLNNPYWEALVYPIDSPIYPNDTIPAEFIDYVLEKGDDLRIRFTELPPALRDKGDPSVAGRHIMTHAHEVGPAAWLLYMRAGEELLPNTLDELDAEYEIINLKAPARPPTGCTKCTPRSVFRIQILEVDEEILLHKVYNLPTTNIRAKTVELCGVCQK